MEGVREGLIGGESEGGKRMADKRVGWGELIIRPTCVTVR